MMDGIYMKCLINMKFYDGRYLYEMPNKHGVFMMNGVNMKCRVNMGVL